MTATGATPWHIDVGSLRQWVAGQAGPLLAASVEQHVVRCERCRAAVAGLAPLPLLEPVWDRVLDEVEAPPTGILPRLLVRLRLAPADARVVAATPSLRLAWFSALAVVFLFSVVAARAAEGSGLVLFLLVAPLAPVAGVAAAYGPSADPSYELTFTTPYSMTRLVLVRTGAVLVGCVPLSVLAGQLLPTSAAVALGWLLPAAGFVVLVLTASAWFDPAHIAVVVAGGWSLAVLSAARAEHPLDVLQPVALALYAALTAVGLLVLVVRLRQPAPTWLTP